MVFQAEIIWILQRIPQNVYSKDRILLNNFMLEIRTPFVKCLPTGMMFRYDLLHENGHDGLA